MKTQKGGRGIALPFLYPWCKMEFGGQSHSSAAVPLGKRPGTYYTGGWFSVGAGLDKC